ncbi:shikimate dehydrogenase (NADP(+)) [Youhaiella tibetensis]|uniref:Shikimate dehydrogenase (NADP(+)) n=1 Tax=Paradevosia tibetensis TaxID=1447062 RepID=A0A5B9DTW1_9HYPH|nr:shikimate dehydrogenase [Youhaiella tibetensis]QEE22502.1 shikimate dehydrogenase [Youhaiella tibetensis]GGF41739.1 shikimate dehydrogenase (NADP(+)) [Youhaiella tibetensis]
MSAPVKAFVIGHPIAHSRSPLIHGTWLETYGIAGSYEAIDVAPGALPDFIVALRAGAFAGGNVTIPHKETVFALCDEVDPLARRIGAVNTLVSRQGKVRGTNTDYLGFLGNLDQEAPGWDGARELAIVLGAGGAARAILVALAERGFSRIAILNRTADKARALADEMGPQFSGHALSGFADLAPRASLLVNTSSIGMHGSRFEDLPLDALPDTALVTDIVYTPLQTPLLAEARARKLRTVDGLGMLLHQAVPGFEAWFGTRPEVTAQLRERIEATLEH